MPTARGWLVGVTGLIVGIIGRALGAVPVEQVGFALIALVGIAVAIVRLGRHDLEVTRRVAPERAASGAPITVTIDVLNRGRGPAPMMLLEDRLPRGLGGRSRFALSGIEPGGTRSSPYELRPARRGRYRVGPLEMSFIDPFALASTRALAASEAEFLVYPSHEELALPRDLGERRSVAASAMRQPTGATGEEFYTLREYHDGDDLRRIHWPSTAKRRKYMIRQEETPWHTRATVLIDDRSAPYESSPEASFERAVEAAASLIDLYHRSGYSYRLVGAHSPGLPSSKGTDAHRRCLDLLATLPAGPSWRDRRTETGPAVAQADPLLVRMASLESATTPEGALVVVTGTPSTELAVACSRARRRFRQVAVVCFPAHRFGTHPTKARWDGEKATQSAVVLMVRSGVKAMVLGPGEPLQRAWSSSASSRGTGGGDPAWAQKPELV